MTKVFSIVFVHHTRQPVRRVITTAISEGFRAITGEALRRRVEAEHNQLPYGTEKERQILPARHRYPFPRMHRSHES